MSSAPPLTVELTRGPFVESRHQVHAVLLDSRGKTRAVYGDASRLTFPRSTLKPLQTISLIESGAADAFNVTEDEIALASASHNGEEKHTTRVRQWLARLGLGEKDLECGAHAPYGAPCQPATTVHNNCSGKHTGMLTQALNRKAPTLGYTKPQHAVQQEILAILSQFCGTNLTPAVCGIDGCSAPNPAMPLENIARGFAAFLQQLENPTRPGEACRRIFQAMTTYPDLAGGSSGRLDTLVMQAARGKILAKTGAEGTYIAVIPEHDTVLALKTEDGAGRAGEAALYRLLEKHKLAESSVLDTIRPQALPVIKNWRGLETGNIKAL